MISKQNLQVKEQSINNNTNHKQRQSMIRYSFHPQIQKLPYPSDDQDDREIQEDTINLKYSQNLLTSPPRNSIIRQNQIWQGQPSHKQIYIHSDEYYNDHVAIETNSFLRKMMLILDEESQSLLSKRKNNVETMISRIKAEFSKVKEQLHEMIGTWCKKTEQQEIHYFLQRGELTLNGELIENYERINTKRQQLQEKISNIQNVLNQQKPITNEEMTRRSLRVKKLLRDVWDKEYQFSVDHLKKECQKFKSQQIIKVYTTTLGPEYQVQLKENMHKRLGQFTLFQVDKRRMIESQLKEQTIRKRSVIMQDLMDRRSSQVQELKQSYLRQLEYSKTQQKQH